MILVGLIASTIKKANSVGMSVCSKLRPYPSICLSLFGNLFDISSFLSSYPISNINHSRDVFFHRLFSMMIKSGSNTSGSILIRLHISSVFLEHTSAKNWDMSSVTRYTDIFPSFIALSIILYISPAFRMNLIFCAF